MENASKALLMAAGVLMALIVIGAFLLMLNGLSDYQNKSEVSKEQQQLTAFNNQFYTYDRADLRGTDMLSLMNSIIDYNNRKTAPGEGLEFTEMKIDVEIRNDNNGEDILSKLRYETDGNNLLIKKHNYTQDDLTEIVTKPQQIEARYQKKYIEKLVSDISKFMDIYNNSSLSYSEKVAEIDRNYWLPVSATNYDLEQMYEDILVYYEYTQFKRTYFDSKGNTQRDLNTGRIISMSFKATRIGD